MNQGRVTVDTFTEPPPSAAGYQHQEVPRKQSGSLRDQQPRGPLPPDPIGIPSTSIDPQSPNHYVAWGSPCPLWASGSSGLSDGGLSQAVMVPPPSPGAFGLSVHGSRGPHWPGKARGHLSLTPLLILSRDASPKG